MRIIIISDISDESESIIPWGLNLGKHTETEVDILHIIDPREYQGVESPFGDSQSITPGEKLSHQEILNREKTRAGIELDKLLSKEASRLNYPLKINTIIETEELEKKLKTLFTEQPESLLVSGMNTESTVFRDLDEFMSIIGKLNNPAFIIPPGTDFHKPEKVFLLTDFSHDTIMGIKNVFKWLKPFGSLVNACEVTKKMNQYIELELFSKRWEKKVKEYADSSIVLKTNRLKGDDYNETIINYVGRNEFEWVVIPRRRKESSKKIFSVNITKKLTESLNKPIMLY